MALSKAFAVGELLTAEDVNDHIVNHVPAPGDPYVTPLIRLPNPGGWSAHTIYIYREGITAHMTCNAQVGTSSSGAVLGVLPEGFRPPVAWEITANNNYQGGSPGMLRIQSNGQIIAWWASGPGPNNWIRTSGDWPVGIEQES